MWLRCRECRANSITCQQDCSHVGALAALKYVQALLDSKHCMIACLCAEYQHLTDEAIRAAVHKSLPFARHLSGAACQHAAAQARWQSSQSNAHLTSAPDRSCVPWAYIIPELPYTAYRCIPAQYYPSPSMDVIFLLIQEPCIMRWMITLPAD